MAFPAVTSGFFSQALAEHTVLSPRAPTLQHSSTLGLDQRLFLSIAQKGFGMGQHAAGVHAVLHFGTLAQENHAVPMGQSRVLHSSGQISVLHPGMRPRCNPHRGQSPHPGSASPLWGHAAPPDTSFPFSGGLLTHPWRQTS